jgi:DNA-binding GntR family transcriptional regulator
MRYDLGVSETSFLTGAAGALPSRTVIVLEAIKRAILAGEFAPGQQLVETDLADKLGVSKTPVREALKTLAGAGMVTMSPYKGATVRRVTSDDARHLYDVRLILEPEALARSIAAGHDWTRASEALTRADESQDLVERNLANRDFHDALYQGCDNPLLLSLLADLRDRTALVSAALWRHSAIQGAASWECEATEHRAILQAAQAAQPSTAADLLRAHITSSIQRNFPLEASS